ncbi:hypothetical protein CHS0354_012827 [Potamilus streckersoni]|uniref:ER membrane protein complex subunit 7 beta-sandwich domain-containing protein n=1 Tax=Potamilus streckersoni TaxID=2493646 RepID=A0AAE0W228_9BIVA|nr:hypothetical protein CHS0354_012827 [Potamilus streckersoni]
MKNMQHLLHFLAIYLVHAVSEIIENDSGLGSDFKITGKVEILSSKDKEWLTNTQILVDGGEYIAYPRSDGSFVINGLPSGSFVVEIVNPTYLFEPARVEITSKGKIRARKVNYLQASVVKTIPYPLEFRERRKTNYFQVRDQWKITDFLFNPMVLTMVLPLLMIMVLPKMMNAADPETQKEMQSQMKALNDKSSIPDMSEFLAGLFGSDSKKSSSKSKAVRKK